MTEGLPWPPRKEDLERMYLVERLSAAKIAKVYGLDRKYASPKVAESTILYQLSRNGIRRRERAEHVRKVTKGMEDEWIQRYNAGESLTEIAGLKVDSVTVWYHLKARGVVLRDKVEAQIRAVSKYERLPFRCNSMERAYLIGLRYGDLDAVTHGRAVRVRVSTTHPAMANLFEEVFGHYSHVAHYPRTDSLTGYEWSLESDLDKSFSFLLEKPRVEELEAFDLNEFIAFLAGVFDAEGSAILHKKRKWYAPEIYITDSDEGLIGFISERLSSMGYHPHVQWRNQNNDRGRISGPSRMGRLSVVRMEEVLRLTTSLPIIHSERKAKFKIFSRFESEQHAESTLMIAGEWAKLSAEIRGDVTRFIAQAKAQFELVRRADKSSETQVEEGGRTRLQSV